MKLPYSLAASQIKLNVAFSYPFKNYLSVTHWVQAPESVPRIQLWPTTPWTYLSHNSTKETTLKVAGVAPCLSFVSLLSPHNGAPSQVPLVSSLHRGREWDPESVTTIHIIRLWWSHNSNSSSLGPKPSLHLLGYVSHWKGKILNNWKKKKESNVIEVLLGWWPLGGGDQESPGQADRNESGTLKMHTLMQEALVRSLVKELDPTLKIPHAATKTEDPTRCNQDRTQPK